MAGHIDMTIKLFNKKILKYFKPSAAEIVMLILIVIIISIKLGSSIVKEITRNREIRGYDKQEVIEY